MTDEDDDRITKAFERLERLGLFGSFIDYLMSPDEDDEE